MAAMLCGLRYDADNRLVPSTAPQRKLHPGAGGVCARVIPINTFQELGQ
jgi:hypothetical protein